MLTPDILAAIDKAADELVAVAPPLTPHAEWVIRQVFSRPAQHLAAQAA
jgi:hypothetical protein